MSWFLSLPVYLSAPIVIAFVFFAIECCHLNPNKTTTLHRISKGGISLHFANPKRKNFCTNAVLDHYSQRIEWTSEEVDLFVEAFKSAGQYLYNKDVQKSILNSVQVKRLSVFEKVFGSQIDSDPFYDVCNSNLEVYLVKCNNRSTGGVACVMVNIFDRYFKKIWRKQVVLINEEYLNIFENMRTISPIPIEDNTKRIKLEIGALIWHEIFHFLRFSHPNVKGFKDFDVDKSFISVLTKKLRYRHFC